MDAELLAQAPGSTDFLDHRRIHFAVEPRTGTRSTAIHASPAIVRQRDV
jgi:hypothetical protein